MNVRIIGIAMLIAGASAQALAQGGGPPPPPEPGTVDSMAASRTNRDQQEGYNRLLNQGVKVRNVIRDDGKAAEKKAPVAATAADVAVGAAVRDKNGVQIATVEKLEADGVVIKSGDRLAKLPLDAFGKDDAGLLLGVTGVELQAAIAKTAGPVPQEPQVVAATAADLTPGAAVRDSEGAPIGTVDTLVEGGAIVLTDGKKVKLAVDSFGKDEKGLLIGITASEFKTIISNSTPAKTDG